MDEGSGWLVSASTGLLNLWGANPRGGVGGEPCLQLVHSQEINFDVLDLAAAPELNAMYIAMTDEASRKSFISVHSLAPESMLAPREKYSVPQTDGTERISTSPHTVVSLYNLGGPLEKGFAAAYGNQVAIWSISKSDKPRETPLVQFSPHKQAVSVLCLSSSKPVLFSGSASGDVSAWSLQSPPTKPLLSLKLHKRSVSGIEQVEQNMILTSSLDGKVMVWDLRSADKPIKIVQPDGGSVQRIAASPIGDCGILCTAQNMYTMNLIDLNSELLPVLAKPPAEPFENLTWNRQTLEVYAACSNGSISVFRS